MRRARRAHIPVEGRGARCPLFEQGCIVMVAASSSARVSLQNGDLRGGRWTCHLLSATRARMQEKVPAARHAAGVVMLCSLALDRAGRASLTPCMADEAALTMEAVQTVQTPYGQALRCNGVSKTGKRCGKAALRGAKTCGIHGPTGAGYWSRDGVREDHAAVPRRCGGVPRPADRGRDELPRCAGTLTAHQQAGGRS